MPYSFKHLEFSPPPGFRDLTYYVFQDPKQCEKISVTLRGIPLNSPPLDSFVQSEKKRIQTVAPATLFEPDQSIRVGPFSGIQFTSVFLDSGRKCRAFTAFAQVNSKSLINVLYSSPALPFYNKRFATICSLMMPSKAQTLAIPHNFELRSAGPLAALLPVILDDPNIFSFQSPDAKINISLEAYPSSSTRPFPKTLSVALAAALNGRPPVNDPVNSVAIFDGRKQEMTSYLIANADSPQKTVDAFALARLCFPAPIGIVATAQAPSVFRDKLNEVFLQFIQSIKNVR